MGDRSNVARTKRAVSQGSFPETPAGAAAIRRVAIAIIKIAIAIKIGLTRPLSAPRFRADAAAALPVARIRVPRPAVAARY